MKDKKTEVIMDFGSITIPDSWDKLTLNSWTVL